MLRKDIGEVRLEVVSNSVNISNFDVIEIKWGNYVRKLLGISSNKGYWRVEMRGIGNEFIVF